MVADKFYIISGVYRFTTGLTGRVEAGGSFWLGTKTSLFGFSDPDYETLENNMNHHQVKFKLY